MARSARKRPRAGRGAVVSRDMILAGPYQVELTRKRIARAYLRVRDANGPVLVSAPATMGTADVIAFVLRQADWIERRRAALAATPAAHGRRHVREDGLVDLWGEAVAVQDLLLMAGKARLARDAAQLTSDDLEKAVREALRAIVRERVTPLVAQWEQGMGVEVRGIAVHDTTSRWGSCNVRTHRVNFSLWLGHYPPECLELIVVHELTHLLEASHGKRFYAIMERHLPDWRRRDALLKSLSRGVTIGT